MVLLSSIFYGITVGAIFFNLYQLIFPSTIIYFEKALLSISQNKNNPEFVETFPNMQKWVNINMFFLVWYFLSIFSSYFFLFPILMWISLKRQITKTRVIFSSILSILILSFILFNKFYLHLF